MTRRICTSISLFIAKKDYIFIHEQETVVLLGLIKQFEKYNYLSDNNYPNFYVVPKDQKTLL